MNSTGLDIKTRIKLSKADTIFDFINYTGVILITLLVLYPLYLVVISSISSPEAVALGKVILFPKGITFEGFQAIFEDRRVFTGFMNSFYYTIFGTILNVISTVLAGYSLSRKDLMGKTAIMFFFVFTMYFDGGIIPAFILVQKLGLYGSRTVMIIMDLVMVYMIIIARTYYSSTIPNELLEASKLDGCNDMQFFFQVVIPLSQALTAVLLLFYGVAHWNQYIKALIYLRSEAQWPLQLVLRKILIQQQMIADDPNNAGMISEASFNRSELVKYCLIIVASIPMLSIYPFVQRHFVKGVMIGSVKG